MKKIYFIIALLLMSISTRGYSQALLSYTSCGESFSMYYEKDLGYNIEVLSLDSYYDNITFAILEKNFPEFREALTKIRDKYVEWSKVALKNKITKLARRIDIPLTATVIFDNTYSDKLHWSDNSEIIPIFQVDEKGPILSLAAHNIIDTVDACVAEGGIIMFLSLQEIDDFIAKLDSIRTVETLFN